MTTGIDQCGQQTRELFHRVCTTEDVEEQRGLLEEIIVLNMAMADAVVSRYTGRGVATEDLRQVAYTALTRAAHRFDPTRGTAFAGFAVPNMRGEVRKYFRDHAWMIRPTRRIQELQPQINRASDDLWRELGCSPRPSDIAVRIDAPVDMPPAGDHVRRRLSRGGNRRINRMRALTRACVLNAAVRRAF
ncbi:sigma factor [Marmoricola sp. URHB0036]|uniref:sigma factor n=1 Tax=Marmoricola sp. URHB0036 TaxID=1298863 RepID=UPI0004244FAB|nr:sigma factor [Marmoricola sp. URHB0036]